MLGLVVAMRSPRRRRTRVMSSFKGKDAEDILAAAARAAEAVECYITKGADRAMNLYN